MFQSFSLSQNYPNPFNPSTTIKYQIAKNCFVTLKIYDLLGREMRTLINESKKVGVYEISWDGKDKDDHSMPSGAYIYKIKAGNFVQSKKMLFIK